ncbi:MAG: hypothetical protein JKY19_15040, partial [Alcanivoracaceae bacterium]|nr:hypothetical protein [Alcanivoracaceae bacterium]
MNRRLIQVLILLISTQINAVHLSSNGTGQVLIFPYYTVNGGFNTLINLVNSTSESKAMRVRFREAANGREVFTFNLYLGPHDVWTGGLVKTDEGQGFLTKLISSDSSCTVPEIDQISGLFYQEKYIDEFEDVYGINVKRLHEGFIEVLEMGVLTGDSAAATIIDQEQASAGCSRLQNAWDVSSDDGYWSIDPSVDMLPPSGGIMGNVILIDVNEGVAMNEDATVLDDFSDDILHFNIDNDSPSLADSKMNSAVENNAIIINMDWPTGFEAVSSVLMKSQLSNEYALDTIINAKTDWIVTLPTAHFHTDPIHLQTNEVVAPFTSLLTNNKPGCEPYFVSGLYNREELVPINPPGTIIPGTPTPPPVLPTIPSFCYTTNNISILMEENNTSTPVGIFASNHPAASLDQLNNIIPEHIVTPFNNGWVTVGFSHSAVALDGNSKVYGLPAIGFAVQKYTNAHAGPGLLAQYAGIFKHKSKTIVTGSINQGQLSGMNIAKDNTGQVLLYPYYTVRNGLNTLISVVNTTDQTKALKVRFLEGRNGRPVLDFNLYLSPFDVWTAGLVETSSTSIVGAAFTGQESVKIVTSDTSCTVPTIDRQEFLPFAFSGAYDDGLIQDMIRVTEGSLEIIEMAEVIGEDASAATHGVSGVPESCETLNSNWLPPSGKWVSDPTINMEAPDGTGGLYGSVNIIDVAGGVDMSYDATAIVGYNIETQHHSPGNLLPNLASGTSSTTLIEANGNILQTTWDSPLNAVTALFMQA